MLIMLTMMFSGSAEYISIYTYRVPMNIINYYIAIIENYIYIIIKLNIINYIIYNI